MISAKGHTQACLLTELLVTAIIEDESVFLFSFRKVDKDMFIGGYRIPKGTPVQLPVYPMHLSPHNYLQPSKFWPERWMQQSKIIKDPGTLQAVIFMRSLCAEAYTHVCISYPENMP